MRFKDTQAMFSLLMADRSDFGAEPWVSEIAFIPQKCFDIC